MAATWLWIITRGPTTLAKPIFAWLGFLKVRDDLFLLGKKRGKSVRRRFGPLSTNQKLAPVGCAIN